MLKEICSQKEIGPDPYFQTEKKYLEQNLKKTLKSGEILFECTYWLKNGDTYHLISIKAFNIRNGLAELWH